MRTRVSLAGAAALISLVAAGCGTTVTMNGASTPAESGTGLGSGGLGASPAPAGGSRQAGPGTSAPGLPGGSGGGSLTGAPSAASSTGGPAGRAPGPTGPGSQATTKSLNGPGVTATTITVADAYDPSVSAADQAIGAANANPGDTKAETDAVVNYINHHGGIAGRQVKVLWYRSSVANNANVTWQQACQYWTRDNKSFIILGAGSPILDQCSANAHGLEVAAGLIVNETSQVMARYPQIFNLTGMTIDRSMRVTLLGLARQGYFSHGAKVGLVTWDYPYYHYGISSAAEPELERLGLHNVPVAYITPPQSYGDLGATSASVSNAVLKMRQKGINHVVLFDGAVGINSAGVLVLEWMQQANSQAWYPKYGLNSTSGFNGLASDYPQREQIGAVGVDWQPMVSATPTEYSVSKMPKAAQSRARTCIAIMRKAGQPASNNNQRGLEFSYCDTFFFLQQALRPLTGKPLNQADAIAAMNAIGTTWQPLITFSAQIDAQRHDGAAEVANMAYAPDCSCYRYTSGPYKID